MKGHFVPKASASRFPVDFAPRPAPPAVRAGAASAAALMGAGRGAGSRPPTGAGIAYPELFIARVMCIQVPVHSCSPVLPPQFLSSPHIFPNFVPKLHLHFSPGYFCCPGVFHKLHHSMELEFPSSSCFKVQGLQDKQVLAKFPLPEVRSGYPHPPGPKSPGPTSLCIHTPRCHIPKVPHHQLLPWVAPEEGL